MSPGREQAQHCAHYHAGSIFRCRVIGPRTLGALKQAAGSEAAAIDAVQKVFSQAFSEHDFPRSACEEVGREVFAWWEAER